MIKLSRHYSVDMNWYIHKLIVKICRVTPWINSISLWQHPKNAKDVSSLVSLPSWGSFWGTGCMIGESGTASESTGVAISTFPNARESVADESGVSGHPRSLGVPPFVATASWSWLSVAWMESNVHASSLIFHVEMDTGSKAFSTWIMPSQIPNSQLTCSCTNQACKVSMSSMLGSEDAWAAGWQWEGS